jgi:hypothetical protein
MSASLALFINLDGLAAAVTPELLAARLESVVRVASRLGSLAVRRAFADFDHGCICDGTLRSLLRPLLSRHAILVEQVVPSEGPSGEAVRLCLAMDALAAVCQMPTLRGFVFAGLTAADLPLLAKLRELDRRAVVVGAPDDATQTAFTRLASEFVPYVAETPPLALLPAPAARVAAPDAAAYRIFFENRLKCALPPPAARERVYAVTYDVLLHAPPETLPMRLITLSQAVAERIPGADQRTVFKQLFTLVLGGAFDVRRGSRPHTILIKAPAQPPDTWDGLFAAICLSGLRQERPGWPIEAAVLAEVFGAPPERVGDWIANSGKSPE